MLLEKYKKWKIELTFFGMLSGGKLIFILIWGAEDSPSDFALSLLVVWVGI